MDIHRKICFVFLLSLFLLINCDSHEIKKEMNDGVLIIHNPENGLWQNGPTTPLSFNLEKTFGKENEPIEEVFTGASYVFTDNNRNVYIVDRRDNKLVSFDSTGNFLWSKGREGQGPGEFNGIRGVVCDGNEYIFISNSSGFQIDRFDLMGNYLNSFKLADLNIGRASLNAFIKPNIFVLAKSNSGESGINIILLELMNNRLKVKSKFAVSEDIGIELPVGFSVGMDVQVNSDEIVIANIHNYEFKYYNFEGNLVKQVVRDFNKLVRPGIFKTKTYRSIRVYSSLAAPMRIAEGYEISISHWPINLDDPDKYLERSSRGSREVLKYQNMLDLFNTEGELLYSIYNDSYTPEIGRPIHVDKDGKLYSTLSEPFPQVRRYQVHINQN